MDDFIKRLVEEKKKVEGTLNAITVLLESYGVKDNSSVSNIISKLDEINDEVFPIKQRKDKQILWLFNNVFTGAIKIGEIKEVFQKYSGNEDRIDNVVRRLKRENKLKLVKYNENNILSYWGLPNWVGEKDFLAEFKPDQDLLPEIISSEVV